MEIQTKETQDTKVEQRKTQQQLQEEARQFFAGTVAPTLYVGSQKHTKLNIQIYLIRRKYGKRR